MVAAVEELTSLYIFHLTAKTHPREGLQGLLAVGMTEMPLFVLEAQ
jgi:hypothetical protein